MEVLQGTYVTEELEFLRAEERGDGMFVEERREESLGQDKNGTRTDCLHCNADNSEERGYVDTDKGEDE